MADPESTAEQVREVWRLRAHGVALFSIAFVSGFLGAWTHWRWLQIGSFLLGICAISLFFRAEWLALKIRRRRYAEWWDEKHAKLVEQREHVRERDGGQPPSAPRL